MTKNELADLLEISTSALTQQFSSLDVRTGSVEKFCDVLNLKIEDLYGGTKYTDKTAKTIVKSNVEDKSFASLFERILNERDEYKDMVVKLKQQISDMQQGMTISEIAEREVG